MYHRLGEAHNDWERKYCVASQRFSAHMGALERAGHRVADIADFLAWLDGARNLPDGALVITFDDGFKGVYKHAFPVLKDHGWTATIFLVADLIGREDEWCRTSNPSGATYPLMNMDEILAMSAAGMRFHSHSRTHPRLPTLSDERLEDEVAGSRAALEGLLGTPVDCFAYPYGHLDVRVCDAVKRVGYRAAFSTQPGFNRPDVDRLRIRRLDVFGTDTAAMLLRKIHFGANDGSLGQVARYYWRRTTQRLRGAA